MDQANSSPAGFPGLRVAQISLRIAIAFAVVGVLIGGYRRIVAKPPQRPYDLNANEMKPIYQWRAGDSLPDVPILLSHVGGSREKSSLGGLGKGCAILVFFQSGCRACAALAPKWSGTKSLVAGHDSLPVYWVSVSPDDPKAEGFVRDHNLAPRYLEAVRGKDMVDLGIAQYPAIYIVKDGHVLVRKPGLLPAEILNRPGGCKEWLEGT